MLLEMYMVIKVYRNKVYSWETSFLVWEEPHLLKGVPKQEALIIDNNPTLPLTLRLTLTPPLHRHEQLER